MGEDDSFDIGVGFEAVHEASAGVVDHYDGVGALVGNIIHKCIREVVVSSKSVKSFLSPGVDKYETGIGVVVNS